MPTPEEPDFPKGHPKRFDYDPESPEAKQWARFHVFPKGERDFPPGHPKAVDTPGNKNSQELRAGVDPDRPDYEEHTGRSPEQAEAVRQFNAELSRKAFETPARDPIEAPAPPKPTSAELPVGQPGA